MSIKSKKVLFLTGSQELYGPEVLERVACQSQAVVDALNAAPDVALEIVWTPVLTSSDAIRRQILDANADDDVVGLVAWMHTFSPAKLWIRGLSVLAKPLLHLHTQANQALPFGSIDPDFMNLNQAAHGDREFGYILTRMGIPRKTVVGHVSDPRVTAEIGQWARATVGRDALASMHMIRFGDNMRQVADTDGDKVDVQIKLGVSIDTWSVSDLAASVAQVGEDQIDALIAEYIDTYDVAAELLPGGDAHESLRYAARQECGIKGFLDARGATAWVSSFEDLGDLRQLPGFAAQRLMAQGYGYGPEGDWKTALLVRLAIAMGEGLPGGATLMEEYTYHLVPGREGILGSHMLEVSPSITTARPSLELHPLTIVPRENPVRLVFDADPGTGVMIDLVDMGDRLSLLGTEIDLVTPDEPMPNLPTARAYWKPRPDFVTAAKTWLAAGGGHHHALSTATTAETWNDLARMLDVEWTLLSATNVR
ncbi:L-arabinose isomerase [Demequina sp.]|uniref:L-arabinose isomerase n=1 Tax=Demequina sp. TaxID=2050685 RepID=UPI003A874627